MSGEDLRIGVFLCHCGTNIGGFVDVEEVEEYVKSLPGVAFVTRNLYTCAEDGLCSIKDAVEEHDLNRVVVASCTPRTHAPLFQSTCEEAGLNKYLFTFVNIREQCSWVHMKEKERATEKAKDLVRMGVARASLLQPQEEQQIEVTPEAMVVGGGVAGMIAALNLADQGFKTHLVERENELGGYTRKLSSLFQEDQDPQEVLRPMIERVTNHDNIVTYLNTTMKAAEGFVGNYNIVLDVNGEEKETSVGSVVVATGAQPYTPHGLYGYDEYENVVSLSEFEEMARNKTLPKGLKNVAFIQCVGSRG
ncbi:MAG: CoB--CoM heterodisulfide reductase iron-sulfur subunit A family protein, partial [Methanomassiliicoccales archaeon]